MAMTGILTVALACVGASLLVLYFNWRGRLMRRIRAAGSAGKDLDAAA